jgi:DNA-directed RNA polymerase subunit K/omega
MLYPSIQELLKKTEKNGEETLNKYSLVMATAKCARMITNEYLRERAIAERKIANKEIDTKDIGALITKSYRDEKAVKNAVKELKDGEFEVFMPGEEGYETSIVEVPEYEDTSKEEKKNYKSDFAKTSDDENNEKIDDEDLDGNDYIDDEEMDTKDLMGSSEVFEDNGTLSIEEGENNQ